MLLILLGFIDSYYGLFAVGMGGVVYGTYAMIAVRFAALSADAIAH